MSQLRKPDLHFIIADDARAFAEGFAAFVGDAIRRWCFCSAGQFTLQTHVCGCVAEFKRTARELLDQGALVYAVLDMKIPIEPGEEAEPEGGEAMVRWCLGQGADGLKESASGRLEFALISGDAATLSILEGRGLGRELQRRKTKKIHKERLGKGQSESVQLEKDIQAMVRKHMDYCTYPSTDGAGSGDTTVWFGADSSVSRLLHTADKIASSQDGGLYLVFTDPTGWEMDWFRLCCFLAGREAPDILDITRFSSRARNWDRCFRELPEAFWIGPMNKAKDYNYPIDQRIEETGFFEAIKTRKSLVFFQYPRLETQMDVGRLLDQEIEVATLNLCLAEIFDGRSGPYEQGYGFAYEPHPRLVPFPKFEEFRSAGVFRHAVASEIARERAGGTLPPLDPEVTDVLTEFPWTGQVDGLDTLRSWVHGAYEPAHRHAPKTRYLSSAQFDDPKFKDEFDGSLGLLVRSRRIYRILKHNEVMLPREDYGPDDDRIYELENVLELYLCLERLDALEKILSEKGEVRWEAGFGSEQFEQLRQCLRFMASIFEISDKFRRDIEKFKSCARRRYWKGYYPRFERKEERDAVESIELNWPRIRLPLYWALEEYLKENGIFPWIHLNPHKIPTVYPDLKDRFEDNEKDRQDIVDIVEAREEQQRKAANFVRESKTQPALSHLEVLDDENFGITLNLGFLAMWESFVLFNAYLAICEHHYRYRDALLGLDQVRDALGSAMMGSCRAVLENYSRRLRKLPPGEQRSLFWRWNEAWPSEGGQPYAVRLAQGVASSLLSAKRDAYKDEAEQLSMLKEIVAMDPDSRTFPIEGVMLCLHEIRLKVDKHEGRSFWDEDPRRRMMVWDLLRRFIVCTTAEYRIGTWSREPEGLRLWNPDGEEVAAGAANPGPWAGRLCVWECEEGTESRWMTRFPIDDLVRVNPATQSIWIYYNKDKWQNISRPASGEATDLVAGKAPWLPGLGTFETSEIWRSVRDSRK